MAGRQLRRWTPEEIDTALVTLVYTGGNSLEAARQLQAAGLDIPHQTLRDWRLYQHASRYQDLCVLHAPEIEKRVVQRSAEVSQRALEATLTAIDAAEQQITSGDSKDPSAAAKNLALAHGIITDKSLTLQGRPNQIVETQDARDLIREIRKGLGAIDSTATELDSTALSAGDSTTNARDVP